MAATVAQLRQEKVQHLSALHRLTEQAVQRQGAITAGELLDLLAERAALMERVSAIDAECSRLGAPLADPDPALRRCLESLVELNRTLLGAATAQRNALLERLLAEPRR